jgi:uncharacterized protein with NAD-binding domain and iron-sulfur cluster
MPRRETVRHGHAARGALRTTKTGGALAENQTGSEAPRLTEEEWLREAAQNPAGLGELKRKLAEAKAKHGAPKKVAIVGGGMAGMTTAWELTHGENWDKEKNAPRFDVTVYQMGWRLGGKGASGRGDNGRIEEHGLHVWMGFYENAFRIVRDCYDELGQLREMDRRLGELSKARGEQVISARRRVFVRMTQGNTLSPAMRGWLRLAGDRRTLTDAAEKLVTASIEAGDASSRQEDRDSASNREASAWDTLQTKLARALRKPALRPLRGFPFEDWTDAFVPAPHVSLSIDDPYGLDTRTAEFWRAWTATFPPGAGMPGDPVDWDCNPFTLRRYYEQMLVMLRAVLLSATLVLRRDGSSATVTDEVTAFADAVDTLLTAAVSAAAPPAADGAADGAAVKTLADVLADATVNENVTKLFSVIGLRISLDTGLKCNEVARCVLDWIHATPAGIKGSNEYLGDRLRGYLPALVTLLAERGLVEPAEGAADRQQAAHRSRQGVETLTNLLARAADRMPQLARERLLARIERESRNALRRWRRGSNSGESSVQAPLGAAVDGVFRAFVEAAEAVPDGAPVRSELRKALRLLRKSSLTGLALLREGIALVDWLVDRYPDDAKDTYRVAGLLDAWITALRRELESAIAIDPLLERQWQLIGLVLAIVRGLWSDRLLTHPDGFDAIDHETTIGWLRRHKAPEGALTSPFINGLHDLAFANDAEGLAASQGIRGAMRMFFTYRGALFWKMRAGMGDVVFAPLYLVLAARGVKFKFFHRLDAIKVDRTSPQDPFLSHLTFHRQAKTKAGAPYRPLDHDGFWPSAPDKSQLVPDAAPSGRAGPIDLEDPDCAGMLVEPAVDNSDFDLCVLALPIAALDKVVGRDEGKRSKFDHGERCRWTEMFDRLKVTPTRAAQLWLTKPLHELGWHAPPTTLAGIDRPFDTWADMSQTLPTERWPSEGSPRSVAYFCGSLAESDADRKVAEPALREEFLAPAFLDHTLTRVWPGSRDASGVFDRSLFVGGTDSMALFVKANVHPSDRYTLSRPGTARWRISPLDVEFTNATIAGDWTDCGFNGGCVEAAVMSGRLASHALSLHPPLQAIVGFDHP